MAKFKPFGQLRPGEPFGARGAFHVKAGRTKAVRLLGGKARGIYFSPETMVEPLAGEVFGQ